MSEAYALEPEAPRINWSEMFRHSYLFSQGSPTLQVHMVNWLAKVPLKGYLPTLEDVQPKKIAAYAKGEMGRGGHAEDSGVAVDAANNSQRFVNAFASGGNLPDDQEKNIKFLPPDIRRLRETALTDTGILTNIVYDLITQEYDFLGRPEGRPASARDPWSSFIIDYGVLKKGTGAWSYEAVPEAYKQMWEAIIVRFGEPLHLARDYELLLEVINTYISKHPSLASDELAKVVAFKESVIAGAHKRIEQMKAKDEEKSQVPAFEAMLGEKGKMPRG